MNKQTYLVIEQMFSDHKKKLEKERHNIQKKITKPCSDGENISRIDQIDQMNLNQKYRVSIVNRRQEIHVSIFLNLLLIN